MDTQVQLRSPNPTPVLRVLFWMTRSTARLRAARGDGLDLSTFKFLIFRGCYAALLIETWSDLHETNFAPPPRDNQAEVNPSLQRQWLFQSPYQRETSWGPQWDADDDPTALPHGISGLASRQDFYCPVPPETFFQSSSNSWRSNQIPEPPWNRYSTTFSDLDSPSLERNPSLDTDISRRSVSLESHLDAASIFGASDWPGLLPFDPALKESTANAGEQFNLLLEQEAISKSWDLDSLRGSALVPPLHYPLLALPMNSGDVFSRKNVDSNSHRVDLDISGNYGNDSQLFSAQTSPNPAPAGLMERPENSSQIQHQAQPSHMNVSLGCQDHIQPSADHDFSWNRFIVEDGSGKANVPSLPRRKGARHGRLPAHKAKMTAERRKSGKTCIKCRVTRVEVCIQSSFPGLSLTGMLSATVVIHVTNASN